MSDVVQSDYYEDAMNKAIPFGFNRNAIAKIDKSLKGNLFIERITDADGNVVCIVNKCIEGVHIRSPQNPLYGIRGFSEYHSFRLSNPDVAKCTKNEEVFMVEPITNSITSLDLNF